MPGTDPPSRPAQPPDSSRAATAAAVAALLLCAAALVSLGAILAGASAGARPWAGFAWIAFTALPAAFILLAALVVRSIRRRRSL
ncbi:hypothetical protein HER39_08855 [Arthrobacter deserti]|uniref:Multidrug ABC transporter ATPase n=1 Tax=Arthrobacter deserti TaxID=1742687 RepID=A0ABX1JQP5_9MICC|nr:hypothetical protein [Arthrobacter deserti]